MAYWMDRSLNDEKHVLSVVSGCADCGVRTVTTTSEEAMAWIGHHHRRTHPRGFATVKQIGDHLPRTRKPESMGDKGPDILELIKSGTNRSADITAALGISRASVNNHLKRLREQGRVTRDRCTYHAA